MINFIKTIIYIPLYNFLIFLIAITNIDAGLAAVILTILVKIILYPSAKKATLAQLKMKAHENELKEIKEKYKDKETQALKTMEFYKNHKINPLSSIGTLLIQIPIIYSLYHIFLKSGLPVINTSLLYSFTKVPEVISMNFLGLFDVSLKSPVLAFLAAFSGFLQMHFSQQGINKEAGKNSNQNGGDLSQMMAKQMKYTLPVVIFIVSWQISGVVALYWFTSNVVSIIQDYYVKKHYKASLKTA